MKWAPFFGVDCSSLVHGQEDFPLSGRVRRANDIAREHSDRSCIYISIHANAGGGHGIEVFTSLGQTRSDAIATVFLEEFNTVFPEARLRTDESDGDPDKEANFYVLRKTTMPAILTENFFMDNKKECREYLLSEDGRNDIALAHLAAMVEINKEV